jgi:predicted transglutaminase-like cysteine proteinase
MKTGIVKLLMAGIAGYFVTTMALKATASPSTEQTGSIVHRATNWQPVGARTRTPIGWYNLCQVQADECQAGPQRAVNVELNAETRKLLTTVTVLANHTIQAQTDDEHYHIDRKTLVDWWTYPDDGAGDCSDYMMLKRKMLIEAGWPRSAALTTVVIDQHGEGHAVLTVTTDQGDFVLDNLTDKVLRWDQTGYAYVKRQSREDENVWVAIKDGDDPAAVSATHSLPVVKISSR